ncbi:c-type cytochrome [Tundrisphaera lichenicola]|uniref:c-type cytochrome n=1 Tax=Tundrisphaera lichenicola TaxID=2029860 RepID=UPI003EC10D34
MRGYQAAILGLSALLILAFHSPPPTLAHPLAAPILDDDDDDDEKPQRGPRLDPGKAPGLALTLSRGDLTDTRPARIIALGVPAGTPPSPFLPAGPFRAVWEGDLAVPFRSEFEFSAEGRGTIQVEVNGKVALKGSGDDLSKATGKPARLRKGANKLVVTYESPAEGDALVRLSWASEGDFPREPIPPIALARDIEIQALTVGTRLREGRSLLAGLRCLKCHAPDSPVGGPGSMPELATDAPNLADAGARLRLDWMARWIEDPKAFRPASTMPKMLHDQPEGPSRDIAAYLSTLGTEPVGDPEPQGDPEQGGRLFAYLGCVGCHSLPDVDAPNAQADRISLRFVGAKWKPKALVAFLQKPDRHYAWIKMPDFHLSADEAAHLAAYVTSPPMKDLARPDQPAGDPARGQALFASTGCASCHALPPVEGLKATPFAAITPEKWSAGCLAPTGEPGRKAPDFGLPEESVRAVQAIAKAGLDSLSRDCAPEFAERQVKALNCIACHKRDGYDDLWSERKVETDKLLIDAPQEEKDPDGLPYPADQVRPSLTWIGEKLKPEWAASFIAGKVDYKPRPYLRARMPAFPARAEGLAVGLALEHGFPATSPPDPASDPALIPVAKQLVKNSGLNCVSCHNIGKVAAVGVFEAPGINFMRTRERLRRGYFERWARSPIRVEPETKMPTYFNGENSVLPTILEGKADRQIEALWNYILQGPQIEPPGN